MTGSTPSSTSPTTDRRPPFERPRLLDVGRVVKPHGLGGEVVVELWSDRTERLAPGSSLEVEDGPQGRNGGPLVVEASRPHQGRHLVRFVGVFDRSGAEALRGVVLRAPPMVVEGALWAHELVGSEVVTAGGRRLGIVTALEANPASDLLVLDSGDLVPLRFVTRMDPGVQVVVEVPEGLLE